MKLIDGYALMHEHAIADLSDIEKDEDCRLGYFEETIKEFRSLYGYGVRNILEVIDLGMSRNVGYIKRISEQIGINVIVFTRFYKEPFLPSCVYDKPAEEPTQLMERELIQGTDGLWKPVPDDTGVYASVIGEFGTSKQWMTNTEKKVFDAMITIAVKTGVSVTTHTIPGTTGAEQADYLMERGVKPEKVIIGYMDLSQNIETILPVLRKGVSVGFGTVGRLNYCPDTFRAKALKRIHEEGALSQVVLSMDITRKSRPRYRGGIGYVYMSQLFLPLLSESSSTQAQINMLLRENPERILLRAGY